MTKRRTTGGDGPDPTEPAAVDTVDAPPVDPPTDPVPGDLADTAPFVPPAAPPRDDLPSGQPASAPAAATSEIGVQPVTHATPAPAPPAVRPDGATPASHVVLVDKRGVSEFHPLEGARPRMITLPAPAVDPAPAVRLAGRPALAPQGDRSFERSGTDVDGFAVYTQPEF